MDRWDESFGRNRREPVRQDLQRKRQGTEFTGAQSNSADADWRLHHTHWIDYRFHGNACLQRVQRNEGRDPRFCSKLGAGLEGHRRSGECALAGDYSNLVPNGQVKTSMPGWWDSLDTAKPVVLVTQGTIANRDLSQLIEPAIAALANEQMTVIVAAGRPDLEAIRLPGGTKPDNTQIENFIPFEQILSKIDVFVTNGGFGSVNLSLSRGVPMVVGGDTEDKVFTASRVSWTGTGISLGTGRPISEQIRTAVRTVLSDKKYKNNATRLQQEFAQYNAFDLITKIVNSVLS
jgi:UDP-glucoronosyl and UDP-glucosyl transferase